LDHDALPVWYKNGDKNNTARYHVPHELAKLTLAEKMLIQRVSPFVPLSHIKNGTCGLSGHVCAFEQDIDEFIQRLPRKHTDVAMLKVVKTIKTEVGSDVATKKKVFKIRKAAVIAALVWLKKNNPLYSDVIIDESNMDWIEGDTGYFDGTVIEIDEEIHTKTDDNKENADLGPAPRAFEPVSDGDAIGVYGYFHTGGHAAISKSDAKVNQEIQNAVDQSPAKKDVTIDYPAVKEEPVNEYGDKKIFALAFPWLFPGGIGDIKDFPGEMDTWGKNLLYYKDGRFAADNMFCFFALNYITRHMFEYSASPCVEASTRSPSLYILYMSTY
jgi:hypothetical protein